MNKLPCELMCMIFNGMKLDDLIRFRLACKYWRMIVDNKILLKELNIVSSYDLGRYDRHYDLDVSYSDSIFTVSSKYLYDLKFNSHFTELKRSTVFFKSAHLNGKLFSRLESLSIRAFYLDGLNLNKFQSLKQLEIIGLSLQAHTLKLMLPNLEILYLSDNCVNYKTRSIVLHLDTIKLAKLYTNKGTNHISFKYPDSNRYLKSGGFNIQIFKNLETLVCRCEAINVLIHNLIKLPELKEVYLHRNFGHLVSFHSYRPHFSQLLWQRSQLKRDNLMISYEGFKIIDRDQLFSLPFLCSIFDPVHYSLLVDKLDWITSINYKHFQSLEINLRLKLIDKFRIKCVIVDRKVENGDDLIGFLSLCNDLKALVLKNDVIDQKCTNQLPSACPNLVHLNVTNRNVNNYRLVLKFKFLNFLEIDHFLNLGLPFALELFRSLYFLIEVSINSNQYGINLRKRLSKFDIEVYEYASGVQLKRKGLLIRNLRIGLKRLIEPVKKRKNDNINAASKRIRT